MKTIISATLRLSLRYIACMAVILLASCTNYLNVKPQGYVIPSSEEEFAAIMHKYLQNIEGGGDENIVGNMDVIARLEACADDLDANIKVGSLKAYAGDLINSRMLDWCELYEIIRDCNIVLDNMPDSGTTLCNDVRACAYSIKAICYYNLIRDFCPAWDEDRADEQPGLPLVDRFDISAKPTRSGLRESAEHCKSLFLKSLNLKMQDKMFIFTEYVTKAYLAKLLFWTEDWEGCLEICKDIIENSGYSLSERDEYKSMLTAENEKKGEVLIRSHINNASELDWYFAYVRQYIKSRPASAEFANLFGEEKNTDIRYSTCLDEKRLNAKAPECRVRLSEIWLMAAESLYHMGRKDEALELINQLRVKRIENTEAYTAATLPPLREKNKIRVNAKGENLDPLMQLILDERRKELFMEGDRWFELKRNGSPEWWIINNGLKYTTKSYMYTAPIYKADVDLDPNMKQNEGYE